MKASEWIDAVAAAEGDCSDYRVAKILGISKQAVSNYRTRGGTLDDAVAHRVEVRLGLKPGSVMFDQLQELATDPEVRAIWQRFAKMVAGAAATATLAVTMGLAAPERAQAAGSMAAAGEARSLLLSAIRRLLGSRWGRSAQRLSVANFALS